MIAVAGGILLAVALVYLACWLIERGGALLLFTVGVGAAIVYAVVV